MRKKFLVKCSPVCDIKIITYSVPSKFSFSINILMGKFNLTFVIYWYIIFLELKIFIQ